MTTPSIVEPKAEYLQYAWLSVVALLGSVARAGKWTDATGKFQWQKLIIEIPTAIVLGSMAAGFAAYKSWKPEIAGGLAGAAGLIGPAGVIGAINMIISIRLGGKNAGDPKPS